MTDVDEPRGSTPSADEASDPAFDTWGEAVGPRDAVTAPVVDAEALEYAQDRGVMSRPVETVTGAGLRARTIVEAPLSGGDAATTGSMAARVAHGASWSAISKLSSQGLQFLAGLVLARLLTPDDYGTMASVYVVSGFAILFFELGLGSTVVAMRHPTQADLSTVFWINALGGVVFTVLLLGAGPLVAAFFDDQRLRVLTPLVGLAFLFGLGSVHNGLLQRELRFKTLAVIAVTTTAAGFATTIVLAVLGAGVYALVAGPVLTAALSSLMSWLLVPWRPTGFISKASLPTLWAFSGGQLGFNIVNYWGRNADNALVGRFEGTAPLGNYNKAYQLMLLPVQQVASVLGRVMFPALAAMKDDKARVARGYRRAVRLINIATVPVLVGMSATAPGLVPMLWGNQWGAAVPLLMILCIAGVPQCVSASTGWLYQSQGRTGRLFRQGIVTTSIGLLLMVLGLWLDGTTGVAWAILARAWIVAVPSVHYAGKLVGLQARTLVRDNGGVTLVSAVMWVVVWLLPSATGLDRTAVLTTLLQVGLGIAVFIVGAALFLRPTALEFVGLVRRRGKVA